METFNNYLNQDEGIGKERVVNILISDYDYPNHTTYADAEGYFKAKIKPVSSVDDIVNSYEDYVEESSVNEVDAENFITSDHVEQFIIYELYDLNNNIIEIELFDVDDYREYLKFHPSIEYFKDVIDNELDRYKGNQHPELTVNDIFEIYTRDVIEQASEKVGLINPEDVRSDFDFYAIGDYFKPTIINFIDTNQEYEHYSDGLIGYAESGNLMYDIIESGDVNIECQFASIEGSDKRFEEIEFMIDNISEDPEGHGLDSQLMIEKGAEFIQELKTVMEEEGFHDGVDVHDIDFELVLSPIDTDQLAEEFIETRQVNGYSTNTRNLIDFIINHPSFDYDIRILSEPSEY